MRTLVISVITAGIAAVLVAASAHADDQSYLAYLQSHGTNTSQFPYGPGQFVMVGHMICTNIKAGADPLAGASPIDRAILGPNAVEAAQHELCPETLR